MKIVFQVTAPQLQIASGAEHRDTAELVMLWPAPQCGLADSSPSARDQQCDDEFRMSSQTSDADDVSQYSRCRCHSLRQNAGCVSTDILRRRTMALSEVRNDCRICFGVELFCWCIAYIGHPHTSRTARLVPNPESAGGPFLEAEAIAVVLICTSPPPRFHSLSMLSSDGGRKLFID